MNIAWFRDTAPDASDPLDDTAALIGELRSAHAIDLVTEAEAHDFVWRHFLKPWDLCVYELDNTRAHQFAWAYLLNYPGVVFLKNRTLHDSRAALLDRDGRVDDYATEFRFNHGAEPPFAWKGQHHTARGTWPMLRAPLLASRSVVVPHRSLVRSLQDEYSEARVRYAPGCGGPTGSAPHKSTGSQFPQPSGHSPQPSGADLSSLDNAWDDPELVEGSGPRSTKFGLLDLNRLDVVERALRRAREAGAAIELMTGDSADRILAECDVVISLTWPTFDAPLTAVLAAMAAGKPVVTFELEPTADWPALDPQTWRPRGLATDAAPIAVTIDPRDEEHSLMLAMRRLTSDASLREQLGRAAHAWWRAHATPAHAAAAWNQILHEAASLAPRPRPADWPTHLSTDCTELARAILSEFGLTSDF